MEKNAKIPFSKYKIYVKIINIIGKYNYKGKKIWKRKTLVQKDKTFSEEL